MSGSAHSDDFNRMPFSPCRHDFLIACPIAVSYTHLDVYKRQPVEYPEVTEIVPKIHEAGGLAVLAHPAVYDSYDVMEELLPLGLDGVEVCHPRNHPDDPERLSGFCREHGLIMTGGTDFHGLYTKKPNPLGTCTTGDDQVELMKKRCEKYRKQTPRADKQ